MFVSVRPLGPSGDPGTNYWLNWVFKASCWRDPLCVCVHLYPWVCICMCVYLWVRGSVLATGVGLWTQGARMSTCQQLRRLGSSGNYQMDCLLERTILYIFTCSFHCLSFCSARTGNRMRPSVLFVFAWVLCFLSGLIHVAIHVCMDICIGCMCVCVPTGNTCSDLLLAGPGGIELTSPLSARQMQQPYTLQWLYSSYSPAARVPEVKWNKLWAWSYKT